MSGGMDEAESACQSVAFGDYASVANTAIGFSSLPEYEVAPLEFLGTFDLATTAELRTTAPRKVDAELHIDIASKSCAVESIWSFAAISVRFAEVALCFHDNEVGTIGLRLDGFDVLAEERD